MSLKEEFWPEFETICFYAHEVNRTLEIEKILIVGHRFCHDQLRIVFV